MCAHDLGIFNSPFEVRMCSALASEKRLLFLCRSEMPLFELSILNKQFHTRGTPPKIGNRIASVNMHTNYTGSHRPQGGRFALPTPT